MTDSAAATIDLAMFPGQGSQRPGMAAAALDVFPEIARKVFSRAESATDLPLTELCVSGSKEQLTRTDITQPAVVTTSVAAWEGLRSTGFHPRAVAGHSLGEITALIAANVLEFESGLAIVRRRGELMAQVGELTGGAMAAIIGLETEQVERMCATATGLVEVANYNSPVQTVVSGDADGVNAVAAEAKRAGAKRAVRLDVGAAFHCSLMSTIEAEFAAELDRHEFRDPTITVISSITGTVVNDGEEFRRLLRSQLTRPVRWTQVMEVARQHDWHSHAELGPGKVLAGLVRAIDPVAVVATTATARHLLSLSDPSMSTLR
ncbi:ACP S-malonyltransferase [Nocardia sp. BSTN01]|uniref:ACP S-malonyltransferase n=1 Tax=Nocardia sp. BSTN01 TaxID=2783665 RepID=UPI00188E3935|nr:ACP S-malonyltransferase [Nocardia sp. BSTN01]MBF5002553.1 ACP S-malonyltransferase [Nocardia sp. BSTN01]